MNQGSALVLNSKIPRAIFSLTSYAPTDNDVPVDDVSFVYKPQLMQNITKGAQNMLLDGDVLFTIAHNNDLVIYSVIDSLGTRTVKKMSNWSINPALFSHRTNKGVRK